MLYTAMSLMFTSQI